MSAKKAQKTFRFEYWQDGCAVCGRLVKDIMEFEPNDYAEYDLHEAAKQYNAAYIENKKTQKFGTYIIKVKDVSYRQSGYLCSTCMNKRITNRVKKGSYEPRKPIIQPKQEAEKKATIENPQKPTSLQET